MLFNNKTVFIIISLLLMIIILFFNDTYENLTNLSNEAIQDISSVYNENIIRSTSIESPTINTKNINIDPGGTIKGKQRMHIGGSEYLYLLNRSGVIIGKEWGGNGNLKVQGNITMSGGVISGGQSLVYICNMRSGAAINIFSQNMEYPHIDNIKLQWRVRYHDDLSITRKNGFSSRNIYGKYMSFQNIHNGRYLGVVNSKIDTRVTTVGNIDDNAMWKWHYRYLALKGSENNEGDTTLWLNTSRSTHDINNKNKIILYNNKITDESWECNLELKPVL
jgi:hypothetical protein